MKKRIKLKEVDSVRKVLNEFQQLVQAPCPSCEPAAKPKTEQATFKKAKSRSNEELTAENKILRRLLWICHAQGHGNGEGGEMHFDGIDFKRMGAQEIQAAITHHLHKAVNIYMASPEGLR